MKFLLILAISLFGQAAFDPSLTKDDQNFLQILLTEVPKVAAKKDAAEIEALKDKLKELALANRNQQRPELTLAVKTNYWQQFSVPADWMITSSLAMADGLNQSGHNSPQIDGFQAVLLERRALIQSTEASHDTTDPKNFRDLVAIAQQVTGMDDKKLSDIYLQLRALYVPLSLPPVLHGVALTHELVPQVNEDQWEQTMAEVKSQIAKSRVSAPFPEPMRASFEKSVLDMFFAYKFPLMDMKFRDIYDPEHPDNNNRPDADAAETLASFRSLLRVTQLAYLFRQIDQAGGMRKAVRDIQPQMADIPGLCARFAELAHLKASQWKRIRESGQVILIDPGHLGGALADDDRETRPPEEEGKESYDYREGHDTFLIANLARKLLIQCARLPEANVLVGRRGLTDEGGQIFNKAGDLLGASPSPSLMASDNLYYRKAELAAVKPDFLISIHTDWSDTQTQHGMVITPRRPNTLASGYYKTRSQYEASRALANSVKDSLSLTMFSSVGMAGGKSCNDWIRNEYAEYYLHEMDLQIFRDFDETPVALVEGYDYASPRIRELMNSVVRGHRAGDPDVKQMKLDGTNYFYHTVHQCYAEGVSLGALRQVLQGLKAGMRK